MPASPKHKKGGLLPSFSLLKPAFRKLPSYSRRHKSPEVHALDPTQRIATTVSTLSAAGVPVSRSGIAAASNVATHTVIGKGNARRFKMDTTGRGLPIRAFPEATTRRVMQVRLPNIYEVNSYDVVVASVTQHCPFCSLDALCLLFACSLLALCLLFAHTVSLI